MKMLQDHVVLVTGGGSGLGRGVARYCAQQGASLAIVDNAPAKVSALRQEFGAGVLALQGDVTRVADLQACRSAIQQRFGRLDALIGAQGIFDGNVALLDTPPDRIDALFDEIFHVNVKGYLHSVRMFADLLQQSGGAIVLTTSTAAYAADGGGSAYTASKGAIRSLVGQLAFELAPRVRVNGVAPAAIGNSQLRGPETLGLRERKQSDIPRDAFLELFRSVSLLQDLPVAEDYGPLYAFLASRSNKVMTGQTLVADQGLLNRRVLSAPAS
ncbi:MAG: family oxidoreductase [Ramlibacter sp.]|nr:family oxidoreductase [Ramlibacter sp.]